MLCAQDCLDRTANSLVAAASSSEWWSDWYDIAWGWIQDSMIISAKVSRLITAAEAPVTGSEALADDEVPAIKRWVEERVEK